jgi:hypothetical protein
MTTFTFIHLHGNFLHASDEKGRARKTWMACDAADQLFKDDEI